PFPGAEPRAHRLVVRVAAERTAAPTLVALAVPGILVVVAVAARTSRDVARRAERGRFRPVPCRGSAIRSCGSFRVAHGAARFLHDLASRTKLTPCNGHARQGSARSAGRAGMARSWQRVIPV